MGGVINLELSTSNPEKSLLEKAYLETPISLLSSAIRAKSLFNSSNSVLCFSQLYFPLHQKKLAWLSSPYLSAPPCPNAHKSLQQCGTQRLGFSCQAKVRVGWVGLVWRGGVICFCHSTYFRHIKTTATITLPLYRNPNDPWPVITFILDTEPDCERSVLGV